MHIKSEWMIPELWNIIFGYCSYQDILYCIRTLYFIQHKNKNIDYNIKSILSMYLKHNIYSNKLNKHLYTTYLDIKSSEFIPTPKIIMHYYCLTYNISTQTHYNKFIKSNMLKNILESHLKKSNENQMYNYKIFKMITSYVNRSYFYRSYVNEEHNSEKCIKCKNLKYWEKLVHALLDEPATFNYKLLK